MLRCRSSPACSAYDRAVSDVVVEAHQAAVTMFNHALLDGRQWVPWHVMVTVEFSPLLSAGALSK